MLQSMLIEDKNNAGAGKTHTTDSEKRTFQAWLSAAGGTATVVIEVSNDPRAESDPASAAWQELGSISLSGANDKAGFTSDAPWFYVRGRLAVPTDAASVSAAMGYPY